jgi:hypothetical protein
MDVSTALFEVLTRYTTTRGAGTAEHIVYVPYRVLQKQNGNSRLKQTGKLLVVR